MFFSLRLWAAYRWVAWSEKTSCTSLLEWVITLTFIQGFSTVRTITYMQWADWVDLSHNGDEILPGKSKTVSIFLDRHWPHLQIRFVWLFSPWPLPRLVKSQSSQLTRILKGSHRDRDKYYSMIKEKRGHLCHIKCKIPSEFTRFIVVRPTLIDQFDQENGVKDRWCRWQIFE